MKRMRRRSFSQCLGVSLAHRDPCPCGAHLRHHCRRLLRTPVHGVACARFFVSS